MRKNLLAMAVAVAAAAPAAAGIPVTITSAGIYDPGTLDATVGGETKSEYAVPLTFTGMLAGAAFDALGFCVDLPHNIYVAIGSQLQETLNFTTAPLSTDGYGNTLSATQVREIGGLAHLGFDIAHGTATDAAAQLAAVQQAIWSIEYPTSTFVATGPYAAAQATYAADFIARAPTLTGHATNIVSLEGVQGQITNIITGGHGTFGDEAGPVPEPASWAMMVAGFGLVGFATRGRRSGVATVAA